MNTIIHVIQGVLLLFAFACMWFGTAMVVAIAAILAVIWLQLVLVLVYRALQYMVAQQHFAGINSIPPVMRGPIGWRK